MKYILIIILSLFSLNVSADKCDSKTKSDLLKEANQIKVDYDEVKPIFDTFILNCFARYYKI